MPEPKEYKAIEAWGRMLGSHDYYIKSTQNKASRDNAPLDAVFYKHEMDSGARLWTRLCECGTRTKQEVKDVMERMAEKDAAR